MPPKAKEANRRIIFSRPRLEVEELSEYLFEQRDMKPGDVGSAAFARVLAEARR